MLFPLLIRLVPLALALLCGPLFVLAQAPAREVPPIAPGQEPAGEEASFPLEVAFDVVEREAMFQYRPRPGIWIELGVGTLADGWGWLERPVLASGASDDEGHVRATLDVPAAWRDDPEARVWARVVEPAWQRTSASFRLGAGGKPPRITPRPGGTLYGTVLDDAGAPVEDAWVALAETSGQSSGSARAGAGGRFVLHWPASAADGSREVRVVARAAGLGAGATPAFPLAGELHRRPLDVRIGGGVTLAGRVLDARGRPVRGLRVTAVPEAGHPMGRGVLAGEGPAGLLVDSVATDGEGRFALAHLAPGRYALHGRHGPEPRDSHLRSPELRGPVLGTMEAPADEPVRLTCDQPRLEVAVVDHEGAAPDLAAALARGSPSWGRSDGTHAAPGVDRAELRLFELPAVDAAVPERPRQVEGRDAGDRAVFAVEPGRAYLVSWSQPGVRLREVRVLAGPGSLSEVRLRLGPPARPSTVTFRVLAPDGRLPAEEPAVEVVTADSGREVATTMLVGISAANVFRTFDDADGSSWSTSLAPGEYRLRAWVPAFTGCIVPHPFPRTPFRPVERAFEVVAGQDLEVELRLGAAGHLDLEPLEPLLPLTEAEQLALVPDASIDAQVIEAARARHGGTFAVLVDHDGERLSLDLEVPALRILHYELAFVLPGHPARGLTPVPPGDWTLLLERPGESGAGRDVLLERPVTIRAGEVTTVRW